MGKDSLKSKKSYKAEYSVESEKEVLREKEMLERLNCRARADGRYIINASLQQDGLYSVSIDKEESSSFPKRITNQDHNQY